MHRMLLIATMMLIGCRAWSDGWKKVLDPVAKETELAAEAEKKRDAYRENRDPAALRWILAHRLENGMSLDDVNSAIGEPGERVWVDRKFKQHDKSLLQSDQTYRWGPDRDGNAIYLFLRDDKLINFDAEKIATQ